MECKAMTCKGEQCKNQAKPGSIYCKTHIRQRSFTFDQEANDRAREEMRAYQRRQAAWNRKHSNEYFPESMPKSYYNMVCGAKTRAGTPCKRIDLYGNCRCKLHGGLSTGPRTAKGKHRSSQNWQGQTP